MDVVYLQHLISGLNDLSDAQANAQINTQYNSFSKEGAVWKSRDILDT